MFFQNVFSIKTPRLSLHMSSQHKLSNRQIEIKWSLEFSFVVFAIVIFGPFYLVVLAFLELRKRFFSEFDQI